MSRRKGPGLDREQVIALAADLVVREGAVACGVNRVARELGIKPPSLYNHVGGNDDLRAAVAIEGHRRVHDSYSALGKAPSIRELALHYRRWALANAGLYRLMSEVSLDPADPRWAPVLVAGLVPFLDAFAAKGMLGEDAMHAIRAVRAAAHGFVLLELDGQFRLDTDVEESWRRMVADW